MSWFRAYDFCPNCNAHWGGSPPSDGHCCTCGMGAGADLEYDRFQSQGADGPPMTDVDLAEWWERNTRRYDAAIRRMTQNLEVQHAS